MTDSGSGKKSYTRADVIARRAELGKVLPPGADLVEFDYGRHLEVNIPAEEIVVVVMQPGRFEGEEVINRSVDEVMEIVNGRKS